MMKMLSIHISWVSHWPNQWKKTSHTYHTICTASDFHLSLCGRYKQVVLLPIMFLTFLTVGVLHMHFCPKLSNPNMWKTMITTCIRFGMVVHVNITYFALVAVSWHESILYLTAIFVKGPFAEMILFVLYFWLCNTTWGNDTTITYTYMAKMSSTILRFYGCFFDHICSKLCFWLLYEWHNPQGMWPVYTVITKCVPFPLGLHAH